MSDTKTVQQELAHTLFLSTMLNLNTAQFCADHGQGAGMVQLGTMLVAPETDEYASYRQRWPLAFLPNDEQEMAAFLADELAVIRAELGEIPVCLSIAGFEIADVVRAGRAFCAAGGHLLELNAHGRVEPWASQGYVGGMSLPQYRDRLIAWTEALAEVDLPLLVKFNAHFSVDFAQACRDLDHISLLGYHFNVRHDETNKPNLEFVRGIRPLVKGALLCSGYAWTAESVQALWDAGADSVGLAQPVMKDATFIARLAKAVAAEGS